MKKVLFVCAENKKRSQMAEAIFNHLSKKNRAVSAGTFPARQIDSRIPHVLEEIKVPYRAKKPRKVTDVLFRSADVIVSFGCVAPSAFPDYAFRQWLMPDPHAVSELREVRDDLVIRIKALLKELGE